MDGYKLESLRSEEQRLLDERRSLELQEASLLSPERLEKLAKGQNLVTPEAGQVVHLEARPMAPSRWCNRPQEGVLRLAERSWWSVVWLGWPGPPALEHGRLATNYFRYRFSSTAFTQGPPAAVRNAS